MIRSRFHPARDISVALASVMLFAWLAALASRGLAPGFDLAGREAVHAFAHPWLTPIMKAASFAGDGWVLGPAGVIIVVWLIRAARVLEGVLFAIAVAGANLVGEVMKLFFHRLRPEPWFGYSLPFSYGFPSGHAFVSFCFFLCLAEVLIRDEWRLAAKLVIWSAAVLCTLTIGLSRVYLGVHYPTDVLASYAAAIAWTALLRWAHHVWQGRPAGLDKLQPTL